MKILWATLLASVALAATPADARSRWTEAQANAWYAKQPWLVGANYAPATAINQLEMWQAETWDPKRIDYELGLAQGIGMNTMRVFLHDQLWQQDAQGFKRRIGEFLTIAQRHGIKPLFVLFDSCWDPHPVLGLQHPPIPGVHNSGWVQGPGMPGLRDRSRYPGYKAYVQGVIGAFATDDRILGWDVWNEPDNGADQYKGQEGKEPLVRAMLAQVFDWARDADPSQPLTSGVWLGSDWTPNGKSSPMEKLQLTQSDVISFHDYNWPETFEGRIRQLLPYGRPILCTEYMARGNGSTFDGSLPIAKRYNVAAMNWGFVDGKTQTRLPWDSWQKPYVMAEPTIWFHEVFRTDGTPYRAAETDLIRRLAAAPKGVVPAAVPVPPPAARKRR
ncbi:cellulase family glycosylhydrolase [Microvirga sp. SRT01]|uniref:Cellulase family glycosylhydrolase n=1 Tax=Sphingomonas longa TaxID=2778730 RepID=A0ABS2D9C7_9SPHN|nr:MULTISPECIES: cellulase family glycosylhydrolase [Alphaproteobacteria]MBM6577538.1 cellulase family glycosylhydrolase [Sphingomonas sp. BT552]MBR7710583.1 cellulase family glycosylhydrolase [Microvirga sp. SRT01]